MNDEKRFLKLCKAIDKAANKWGVGLTNADVVNACLTIAASFFDDVHRDQPCAEKCFGVYSRNFRKLCGLGTVDVGDDQPLH